MTDIAKLGLIIDGGGARREVALTREELIKLANGGREAREILKGAIPPTIVPPSVPTQINAVADAIQRMRQAAAQSTANAFGAQLARQMDMAEQSAMRLQRGLDGVRAAQERMRQASAASQASAMASQLRNLDPFQGAGFGGPQLGPALPQHLVATATAAGSTNLEISKLRQGFTTLAVSAGAVPGPVGRIASSLAPLALGGAVTVGVLAGITAIAFAWQKFREEGEKAERLMRDMHARETSFSRGAIQARIAQLETEEANLAAGRFASGRVPLERREARDFSQLRESFTAPGEIRDRLQETRNRLAELRTIYQRGEADVTRTTEEEANKRVRIAEQEAQKRADAYMRGLIDPYAAARAIGGPAQPLTGVARLRAAEDAMIGPLARHTAPPELADQNRAIASTVASMVRAVDDYGDALRRNKEAVDENTRQQVAAAAAIAQAGLGAIAANNRGNIGGVLAGAAGGALTGAMTGGVWGALAGGAIGLVGGILGMNSHEREERRRNQEAIERERKLREQLNDQLSTEARNAPRGFFLGGYQRRVGSDLPPVGKDPFNPTDRPPYNSVASAGGAGSGGLTIVLQKGAILIDGNRSDIEMARSLVNGLRTIAASTGGSGMSLADAMEMV